jgi:hypothetical protein
MCGYILVKIPNMKFLEKATLSTRIHADREMDGQTDMRTRRRKELEGRNRVEKVW